MQQRWMIGAVAAGSAALGAVFVLGTAPDTGIDLDVPPVATAPAMVAPADDAPVAVEAAAPQPAAAASAPDKGPTWEGILSGEVPKAPPPPKVYEPPIKRPKPPLIRDALPSPNKPLPPDVVGAEVAFEARKAPLAECVQWYAPKARYGEDKVVTVLTITPGDDGFAHITDVAIQGDTDDRYRHFVPCVTEALADAVFLLPGDGAPAVVRWPIWF